MEIDQETRRSIEGRGIRNASLYVKKLGINTANIINKKVKY